LCRVDNPTYILAKKVECCSTGYTATFCSLRLDVAKKLMKNIILLISSFILVSSVFATPVQHPSGPNLSYGAISNSQNIMSDITNPAAGAAVFTVKSGQIRFGVLSSIGGGYEIGDVENLVTEVDNTIKLFTNGINQNIPQFSQIRPVDPNLTTSQNVANVLADLNSIIANTNIVMDNLQKDGYFKQFGSVHAPIMPLIVSHNAFDGSFVFDINKSTVTLASFLSEDIDPVVANSAIFLQVQAAEGGAALNLGDVITSDTLIIVKGTSVTEFSLGYSIPQWQSNEGQLFLGLRANFYKVAVTRSFEFVDSSSDETLDSIFDENKEKNLIYKTGYGIDLGVLWVSQNYRGGATLKNINNPHFDFNTLDIDAIMDPVIKAELKKNDRYEMTPQLRLEGALFTTDQNWVFGVAVDANSIPDPVGHEYQWATISAAYATNSFSVPGFRVGFRANLAGNKLSYLTTGVTLFKYLNLDVAYSIEDIEIEENNLTSVDGTVARSIIVNIGLEISF